MNNRIHFHDGIPHSDKLKEEFESLAGELREEFPEVSRLDVSLNHNHVDFETHLHITGKELELAAKGANAVLRESLLEAFDRARRQLRKHHDKQIFERRRTSRS